MEQTVNVKEKGNVLNIKKFMHNHAYQGDTKLRVSPEAVKEMIGYLDARMDVWMKTAVNHALQNKRKTVLRDDIVIAMSMKDS